MTTKKTPAPLNPLLTTGERPSPAMGTHSTPARYVMLPEKSKVSFAQWLRKQPVNKTINPGDVMNCALVQFLRDTKAIRQGVEIRMGYAHYQIGRTETKLPYWAGQFTRRAIKVQNDQIIKHHTPASWHVTVPKLREILTYVKDHA